MLRQGDTGDWIGTFEGHKGAVWGVDLNCVASKAASGAADFSAKVWNATSGEEELSLTHKHIVKSVNFSRDSLSLATGSNDKLLRIFDLEKPEQPKVTFIGHTAAVKQVLFADEESKMLLSCSDDKTLRLWDVASGTEIRKLELSAAVGGMEIVRDMAGDIVSVAHGNYVSFFKGST
jgi:serine-threonine kinase receptor-associated protein